MKRRALAGQVPTAAPATATARLALRLPSGWGKEKRARGCLADLLGMKNYPIMWGLLNKP